ncbi:MAG: hypothetical protein ING59_02865 [Burkholderiales bacterium]|jgi:hypothetical protein|nr:hypothetical protein [Burkholderiales bacterium]
MTTLEGTLNLPDAMAKEAARMGLLAPDALQSLLRAAIRERRIQRMFAAMDALQEAKLPPLTMDEIQAEVERVREEQRAAGH